MTDGDVALRRTENAAICEIMGSRSTSTTIYYYRGDFLSPAPRLPCFALVLNVSRDFPCLENDALFGLSDVQADITLMIPEGTRAPALHT